MPRTPMINDDPAATRGRRRGLALERFAVDTAASGPQGLTIARDHTPDAVVLEDRLFQRPRPMRDGASDVGTELRALLPAAG